MRNKMVSRSERRVEKRQALMFLAMVLGVALVSFALGVMVGRVNAPPEIVQVPAAAPERLSGSVPSSAKVVSAAPAAPAPSEDLTFFDALPKGEQPPMGSGINLPPQPKAQPEPAQERTPPPPREVRKPSVPQEKPSATPVAAAVAKPKALPPASAGGTYVLQVASFQDPSDAGRLQDSLASRGYSTYVEQADLGGKGVWTRVLIGPFDTGQAASTTASRLLAEEKIESLVRRK
jgi:DedD protein